MLNRQYRKRAEISALFLYIYLVSVQLDIPGSATTVVMVETPLMIGVKPGPLLFTEHLNEKTFLTGVIVTRVTGVELFTSLFGSVPGGMQEMIILSESYDVNHPAVVVIQTVRRILIVIMYPLLVNIILKYVKG